MENSPMREKKHRTEYLGYSRRKKKLCKFNCILWRSFYSSLKFKPKQFSRKKARTALAGNRIEKSIGREIQEVHGRLSCTVSHGGKDKLLKNK